MEFTTTYLKDACEEIDASIFNSDVFYEFENRKSLMIYISRWIKKMPELEEMSMKDVIDD